MNKMIKKVTNNFQKILEAAVIVILLGLVVLMFTGKAGAIISVSAFSLLIMAANVPVGKKSGKSKKNKTEKSSVKNGSQKEKISTGVGRVA